MPRIDRGPIPRSKDRKDGRPEPEDFEAEGRRQREEDRARGFDTAASRTKGKKEA